MMITTLAELPKFSRMVLKMAASLLRKRPDITSCRASTGRLSMISMKRLMKLSTQPPKNPATAPSNVPIASARMMTVTPRMWGRFL